MTDRELFMETFESEVPLFERVLKAIPEDGLDYRPDPKARNTLELATMFPMSMMAMGLVMEKGEADFAKGPPNMPKTVSELASAFNMSVGSVKDALKKYGNGEWDKKAKLMTNGHVDWEAKRGKMLWGILFDLIHHRGQLSTYLRPMGGKVPSIYGPSADSK